jgi:hypothetical protein
VGEHQDVPVDEPCDEERGGDRQLLEDDTLAEEEIGGFRQRGGDEGPDDDADRYIGQIQMQGIPEEAPVKKPDAADQDAGRQGQPEGAENRTAVAVL